MKKYKSFKSEDVRKDALFAAWNSHLDNVHDRIKLQNGIQFEEILEGIATVLRVTSSEIRIQFEGIEAQIEATPEICSHLSVSDALYWEVGKRGKSLTPLSLISIGSTIHGRQSGIHLTINPQMLMDSKQNSEPSNLH